MINEKEAQILIENYKLSKDNYKQNPNKETLKILKTQEDLCINKFSYLVKMRTSKYKKFNNFEDLKQEGFMALFRSMENYDQNKGSFFWWAHKYIGTKISRIANQHTAIRFPLKHANNHTPHKESLLPNLVDRKENQPDNLIDTLQSKEIIKSTLNCLNPQQKTIISMVYGIDYDKPFPIIAICNMLNIPRTACLKTIASSIYAMKRNILENKKYLE